jgi:hypothetical protein
MLMSLFLLTILLAPPEDDEFRSENQSRNVRPGAQGTKEPAKVLRAEDVKELAALDGKSVSVQGKVHSIYVPDSKAVCVLNLGPDFKTCFKVTIFASAWEKWPDGLASIKKKYDKQTLTVEGRIRIYKDAPEIVVNVPSQIGVKE